jgi:acyl-CoA synthetase (NDP forming)
MMALYGLFFDRCMGVNRMLSLGNQVDVNLGDGLQFFAADASTRVIGAFVEGVKDGQGLVAGLRQALEAGKPVVLVKSGRTQAGQRAAATHTAAVAGSDRLFQAVCRQFGAVLVDDLRELLDTLQVFDAFGPRLRSARKLGLISQSGGMGSLAADWCDWAGLSLPPLSAAVQEQLAALPQLAGVGLFGNPTDTRGPSLRGPFTGQTLDPFLADPETDLALLLLARSAVQEADAETADHIITVARKYEKPFAVVWAGQRYPFEPGTVPLGHRLLVEAGIPVFDQASDGIRALQRALWFWNFFEAYQIQQAKGA